MKLEKRIQVKVKKVSIEKGFMVAWNDKKQKEEIVVKGKFKDIFPGDTIILYGTFQRNKGWGKFFECEYYREIFDEYWMAKWLKLQKNLNDNKIVDIIVEKNGMEEIWDDFEQMKKVRSVFKFLMKNKVPEKEIAKIEEFYRWNWVKILEDPYYLLKNAAISVDIVEKVIEKFGCPNLISSKGRFMIENLLLKANNSGHFYLPKSELKEIIEQHDEMNFEKIEMDERFMEVENKIFLKEYYNLEENIAANIHQRLMLAKGTANEELITQWQDATGFSLAPNQKKAVLMALAENFCVVTGGPGVGKTTVCKCITDLLGKNNKILMGAPTGRAAKRAMESTGLEASTVHRLLEYNGERFGRTKNKQIKTDVLVIDESSMIDAVLLLALLEATPIKTKIIFVGDVDQLPSVGPGQILKDLISSGVVPVTKLTDIFRQAKGSPIIDCAYAVNAGELPKIENHEDLLYIEKKAEEEVFSEVINLGEKLYKENDLFDVQVLIPMYKGPVGIDNVNREMQKRLNPNSPSVNVGTFEIRENDKVIQTKNDYPRGVYNGDVGIVTKCTPNLILVKFQGSDKEIEYKKENFGELQLSYAITVHRSQGSEYKFVIIPTVNSYSVMLQKNLLYTAITRSKKKLWMIYQRNAFERSVSLESVPKRNTLLSELLKNEIC